MTRRPSDACLSDVCFRKPRGVVGFRRAQLRGRRKLPLTVVGHLGV